MGGFMSGAHNLHKGVSCWGQRSLKGAKILEIVKTHWNPPENPERSFFHPTPPETWVNTCADTRKETLRKQIDTWKTSIFGRNEAVYPQPALASGRESTCAGRVSTGWDRKTGRPEEERYSSYFKPNYSDQSWFERRSLHCHQDEPLDNSV